MNLEVPTWLTRSTALFAVVVGLCVASPAALFAQEEADQEGDEASEEEGETGDVEADPQEEDVEAVSDDDQRDDEEDDLVDEVGEERAAQIEEFEEAHKRFSSEVRDYEKTIDGIIESEYDQRASQINRRYDRNIENLEARERDQRAETIEAFEEYLDRYPDSEGYTPDALFRLAELHFEKANDEYMRADEAYQDKLERYEAGKRADAPEVPERDYSKTISLFERLIEDWPDYEQADGAYYLLAYSKIEMGDDKEGTQLLADLVEEYPDSRFVPEAWVRIGEYWFDRADGREGLEKAKTAYQEAIEYPESRFYDKALYKLAWAYYRMDEFDQAIKEFKRLVEYSDEQEGGGKEGSVLREEAIQYIAVSLSEEDWDLDGSVDEDFGLPRVRHYLDGDHEYEREVLVQLVDYLFENTRYDVVVEVVEYTLDRHPNHRKNPELHERLIAAMMRDQRREDAFAERRELLSYYGPESEWYDHQQREGNEEAVQYAHQLVKDNLIQSATWYHEQAQKLRREASVKEDAEMQALAREQYAEAAAAYKDFLARYPNDKDIFQWNFYFAECLFYSEQHKEAYAQYRVVRELDVQDNEYREQAAFNAIKSLEYLMQEQVERGELTSKAVPGSGVDDAREAAEQQQETETSDEEMAEREQQKREVQAEEMPSELHDYITAMDRYVVLGLENEQDPELDVKFAFQAAKLYYDFKDYETARERFGWIVDEYPESELAYLAGSLILESYRQEKDYERLAAAADRLGEVIKGEQAEAIQKEVKQYKLGAMFKTAEKHFADKEYEKAAEEYLRLVNDDPEHEYAPKALNNAAVAYENIGRYDSAMGMYDRVYEDYPDSDLTPYALYRVAVNSERFFEFENAVHSYELFYEEFEGEQPDELVDMNFMVDEKRQSALRSAGVLSENLQRYEEAAQLYEQYAEAYPDSDDAPAAQWRAVEAWHKAEKLSELERAFASYRDEFGDDEERASRVLEGMTLIAEYYEDQGDMRSAEDWYEDIVDEYEERELEKGGGASYFAAQAQFRLVEEDYADWRDIKIDGTLDEQERLLDEKIEKQKEITKAYREVWDYGSFEWTLASTYRIGTLFENFANALYDVPVPFEQGTEEWNMYRAKLDDQAIPLEDKALSYYEQVDKQAREKNVVNEWTKKNLEKLNSFSPDEYPLYKEERTAEAKRTVTGASYMGDDGYRNVTEQPDEESFDAGKGGGGGMDEVIEEEGGDEATDTDDEQTDDESREDADGASRNEGTDSDDDDGEES
ncbi:MAG: tetratricopeptide repeat protein [Persicimonas sp.]